MTLPDFQSIMLPMLQIAADEKEHSIQQFLNRLAKHFSLTEQELSEMLPSGKQPTFYNRVGWARTYLSKSGLLKMTRRSHYQITERGKQVLASQPTRVDMKYLEQFPEYIEFREKESGRRRPSGPGEKPPSNGSRTPEEVLEDAFMEIRESLVHELLSMVKQSSPAFFERLVVELLVKMGYGGSRREAARAVGQTGDEGIDGIIDEDRLGLDTIYVQAKKWDGVVGRPEIQKFAGALMGKRAKKGIFITTSHFTQDAINYVSTIDFKVVLIDGKRLAEFMIDNDVGVAVASSYQLKRIDSDYFGN